MPPRNLSAAFWVPASSGRNLEIDLPTELDRPDIGSSGSTKTTEHEVVGGRDVVQYTGPNTREYRVDGACFPQDEQKVEQLYEHPRIKARLPDRGTLDLVVKSYDISPQRTKFRIPKPIRDQYPDDKPYRFLKEFTLEVVEYSPAQSDTDDNGRGGGGGGGSTSIEDVEEDSRTRGAERAVEQST